MRGSSQVKLILPGHYTVVGSRRRSGDTAVRSSIRNHDFPAIAGTLKRIEVKSHEIVEKVAFDLTTEDINF